MNLWVEFNPVWLYAICTRTLLQGQWCSRGTNLLM